jgi:hypothetical protein
MTASTTRPRSSHEVVEAFARVGFGFVVGVLEQHAPRVLLDERHAQVRKLLVGQLQ